MAVVEKAPAFCLAMAILVVACGGTSPSNGPTLEPTARATAAATQPGQPSPAASPFVGRLPIGKVIFDTLQGNPEGDFLGAAILDMDGGVEAFDIPTTNVGLAGIWSPDGKRLLVNAFDGTHPIVGVYDTAARTWSELQPKGMANEVECTDWSPDAKQVICGRGGPNPSDDGLYLVDVAGGTTTRVTISPYHHATGSAGECGGGEGRAVFSGDGAHLAFEQQKCGEGPNPSDDEMGNIVVVNANGSKRKEIVELGGVRTHPGGHISWSPTADVIAFGTQDGKLALINADGSNRRLVALPTLGFVYGPTWSPDGKWLLVTIRPTATGQDDLYVVAPDGSTATRVTASSDVEAYTDWGVAP